MKETPIIFSTEMVRAILEGRKTQTRRIIIPQPKIGVICGNNHQFHSQIVDWVGWKYEGREAWFCHKCGVWLHAYDEWSSHGKICRYGQKGDLLWVRQTFSLNYKGQILTKAEKEYLGDLLDIRPVVDSINIKWTPAIFMKKEYASLWLEITGIRVERLQDITEEDAIAEGSPAGATIASPTIFHKGLPEYKEYPAHYIWGFQRIWDKINTKRGYGWSTNPWVWAITFKRVDKNGN